MATSRKFAYNTGSQITGATQYGNLAIGVTLSSYADNPGGVKWWNGPDEDLGYVIARSVTSGNQLNPKGLSCSVGFWRTISLTDQSFLTLVRQTVGQTFDTASSAATWLNSNGYWTSYSVSSTLGTLENPAVSAQAIYNSGQTTNGWYYIQTSNMVSAKQIYCNMTDQGGGWMLMNYNPDSIVNVGNPYPNQWIGGTGSLTSKLSIDARQIWYHNGTAQCSQVMKMASTTASLVPLLNNVTIANRVVYSNPNNLRLSATFSTTLANNTPMTGTWSGIKGHTLMSTSLAVNAPGDWIYSVNTWWTVCGPSSQLSADGRSGNGQGSGSWTNIGNSAIYGMADVAATTSSLRSDIKTYAVYIK
jgi:hypothetical protein